MNTFVLKQVYVFRKVRYYTVHFTGKERSEFADFLERMKAEQDPDHQQALNDLKAAIRLIGDKYGAEMRYFRDEQDWTLRGEAMAIPSKYLLRSQLRLYCQVLSPRVVILFNGDVKTKRALSAQECLKVGPHFRKANELTRVINEALEEEEYLRWDPTGTMLEFSEDQVINPHEE